MTALSGKIIVALDPKARLSIPVRYRNAFPEDQRDIIWLTRGLEPCLSGYCLENWESFKNKIQSLKVPYATKSKILREIIGSAVDQNFDKQGRITIPLELLKHAQLQNTSEALIIGCDRYLEIWNPSVYEKQQKEAEPILHESLGEIYFD